MPLPTRTLRESDTAARTGRFGRGEATPSRRPTVPHGLRRRKPPEQGKTAGKGAGLLGGAGAAALLALGALSAALITLLDDAMATWVAALIVTVLWAIVAAVLAKAGQAALQRATPPAPQTVETVKEDVQWAKNPTGSVQR